MAGPIGDQFTRSRECQRMRPGYDSKVVAVLEDRRVGIVAGHDRIEERAVAAIGLALSL
jgi:hypothetical protein